MAVAGFGPGDIEIVARENVLTVAGRAPQAPRKAAATCIAASPAAPSSAASSLADHIVVEGANLENGLLQLAPEAGGAGGAEAAAIPVQAGRPQPQIAANEQADQAQAAKRPGPGLERGRRGNPPAFFMRALPAR